MDFGQLLRSRKFWVLIVAMVTAIGSYLGGLIDGLAMVQLVIAALAVYSTGIAIVDSGQAIATQEALKTADIIRAVSSEKDPCPDIQITEHTIVDKTTARGLPQKGSR